MSVINRSRHQRVSFVTGVAEHQTLVAGAFFQRIVLRGINTLRDVGRLLVKGDENSTAFMINAVAAVVIADSLQRVANH